MSYEERTYVNGQTVYADDMNNLGLQKRESIAALTAHTYVHEQMSAEATWTVTHNLGRKPAVSVVDSAGTDVVGDIQYINDNVLVLSFNGGFSGKAYCN